MSGDKHATSYKRGFKEARRGLPNTNPFTADSLFYRNYEAGYAAGSKVPAAYRRIHV